MQMLTTQRTLLSDFVIVGAGGCCGALASFLLARTFFGNAAHSFPWKTLCINVMGSFILSVVYFALEASHSISAPAKEDVTLFVFSFTGAFTSLSAFALESFVLADEGKHAMLFLNLLATVALALTAVVLGKLTVSLLGQPTMGMVKQSYRIVRAVLTA